MEAVHLQQARRKSTGRIRPTLVFAHRWLGLVMALFLMLVGVTGSLIVWNGELDRAVWPVLRDVTPTPGARPLDALALRRAVLAQHPGFVIDRLELEAPERPGMPQSLDLTPIEASAVAEANEEVWYDPFTARELGRRRWGDIRQGTKNLIPFLYELHDSLALDRFGQVTLGVIALIWAVDCFIGAALTFPRARPFWKKWQPALGIQRKRLNFDLHRAGGLWLWAMLFVIAWSSVAFNLREVYKPAMRVLLAYHDDWDEVPDLAATRRPAIDMEHALALGRTLVAIESDRFGFRVDRETRLMYVASKGAYYYAVHSDRDVRDRGGSTALWIDGDTGGLLRTSIPTGRYAGNTVTEWIGTLHTVGVWGLPWRVFMTVFGTAVATLSVTGIVIWWRKRKARRAGVRAATNRGLPRAGSLDAQGQPS